MALSNPRGNIMEQNVGSLQDILFRFKRHITRVEELEQQIIELKLENQKLSHQRMETRLEFQMYGQTLVNERIIDLGLEPYQCELCNAVESGNSINHVPRTSLKGCTFVQSIALHPISQRHIVCVCDKCNYAICST